MNAMGLTLAILGIATLQGCAEPYALPEPPTAPTMAFPSSASAPLPAYVVPIAEEPVSMTLDGAGPVKPPGADDDDADVDASWLAQWPVADPAAPGNGAFRGTAGRIDGRSGPAIRRPGDGVVVPPGGGWIRRDGNIYVRSDGSSTVRVGDVFFHSDGSWTRRSGDVLLRSDGTSCRLVAAGAFCDGRRW